MQSYCPRLVLQEHHSSAPGRSYKGRDSATNLIVGRQVAWEFQRGGNVDDQIGVFQCPPDFLILKVGRKIGDGVRARRLAGTERVGEAFDDVDLVEPDVALK